MRAGGGSSFLFWPRHNRILEATYSGRDRVTAIDARHRRAVRVTRVGGRIIDAAMVRDRLVVLVGSSGRKSLSVFDGDGRHERNLALPGLRHADLHSASPTGEALVVGGHRRAWAAVAYDPVTRAVRWRDLPHRDDRWIVPTRPGMLATEAYVHDSDAVDVLDPRTLAVVRTVLVDGYPLGAGTGFSTLPARERGVSLYDGEGKLVWRHPRVDGVLGVTAAGDRVYAAAGYGRPEILIYDRATGALVHRVHGRRFVFQPRRGLNGGGSTSNDSSGEE